MAKKSQITTLAETDIVDRKTLTLDEIENKMVEIAMSDSNDPLTTMINEKKIAMLEKVANVKLRRLQLKALEQQPQPINTEPITVKFVSSKTMDQQARLERIDKEIIEQGLVKTDA